MPKRKRRGRERPGMFQPYWNMRSEITSHGLPHSSNQVTATPPPSLCPGYGSWFQAEAWKLPGDTTPEAMRALRGEVTSNAPLVHVKVRLNGMFGKPTVAARHPGKTVRMREIPLRLEKGTRGASMQLFGICPATYNACVAGKGMGIEAKAGDYRRRYVGMKAIQDMHKPHLLSVPQRLREASMMEYFTVRKAAFSNMRAGNIKEFKLQFRSRKNPRESITISTRDFAKDGSWLTVFFKKANVPRPIECEARSSAPVADVKLVRQHGGFFLQWPMIMEYNDAIDINHITFAVSIDPGVRSVVTTFGTDGVAASISDTGRMEALLTWMDGLQSSIDSPNRGRMDRRSKMVMASRKRHLNKLREKRRCLLKDVHCRIANSLSRNYDLVIYPQFSDKEISENCTLKTKTLRSLYNWGHYKLRMRVKDKVEAAGGHFYRDRGGVYVQCGSLNDIGSRHSWTYMACSTLHHRDVNGAKGIMCRFIA